MPAFRVTTNGMFRNYRSNLMKSNKRLSDTMTTVQTERNFNTYAEDPAAASRAFQMRRNLWRTYDQIDNSNYVISKFETGYSSVMGIIDGNGDSESLSGIKSALEGITGTAGAGRKALGQDLLTKAESMVRAMNVKYGDDFIFAGADGLNVPFEWNNGQVTYRGVDVSTPVPKTMDEFDDPAEYETYIANFNADNSGAAANGSKLLEMSREVTYVDIGLGFQVENGEVVPSSAYNSALSGLNFLGFGVDEDGDPKNLAVLMGELGSIFSRCDATTGEYASTQDRERAMELVDKVRTGIDSVVNAQVKLTSDTSYLRSNLTQLDTTKDTLNEQIDNIERIDPADAITSMMWAQYSYNAALRVGSNLLSQSLIDYMN